VLCASDGRGAVEVFRERAAEIDAVLLDLTMPGLSGAEVFTALRAVREDVPVVVWSGYGETEIAARFGEHKPDAVLHKPFQPSELFAGLRKALEKPRGAARR
jgi:DNA-binding response OmpR family regulator